MKQKLMMVAVSAVLIAAPLAAQASGKARAHSSESEIHVIGKDSAGNTKMRSFAETRFGGAVMRLVERVSNRTMKKLEDRNENPHFKLTRVTTGLALEVEAGVKEVAEIAANAAFELRFEPLPEVKGSM